MPTIGHTLAPHARLLAKSSKLKASSNQFLTGPESKEQFPLRFPAPKFQIGMLDEPSHDARMKVATIIARVLLGLIFVVFGSNIFLHFIPMPPPSPGLVGDFTKALFLSHYLHVVAVFQIVGGLLLLIGRFVPLGLLLLAPVIVNIDLVHILMDPSGLPMASVISILLVFLVWRYRDAFAGIVRA